MARYQVTLNIVQDLLSHSLFVRLILWSADAGRNRILLTSKISIALAIHSLDLRWSENQTSKEHSSWLVIERKTMLLAE